MKGHPVLTCIVIFVLVFMQACTPKPVGSQPVPSQPAQHPSKAVENPTEPAVTAMVEPTEAAAEVEPTPAPNKEPLPGLALDAPQGSKAEAAARLAEGLSIAANAVDAYPLVVELLAWNGIPVYDAYTGELLVAVVEPAAEVSFFDFEAYGLALDYMNGSGLLLSEVAEALAEAETTLNEVPISADFLEDLLSRWVITAREIDPESWEAFTPLFLAESALRKPHAIDLSYPGYGAGNLHYSHLEWLLFFAAQARTGREVPGSLVSTGGGGGLAAPLRIDMCTLYQMALS